MFKKRIIQTGCFQYLCSGSLTGIYRRFLSIFRTAVFLFVLLCASQLAAQTGDAVDAAGTESATSTDVNTEAKKSEKSRPVVKTDSVSAPEKSKQDAGNSSVVSESKKSRAGAAVKSSADDSSPDADNKKALSDEDKAGSKEDTLVKAETSEESETSVKKTPAAAKSGEDETGAGAENAADEKALPTRSGVRINRFLEISEGDFKYSRIPGISLKKDKAEQKYEEKNTEDIQDTEEADALKSLQGETDKTAQEKTVLGMKKGTADILIKVLLILLIVGLIILFKFRSKSRNHKVLRRFPGA